MKLVFTIAIFVCWSALSTADELYVPNYDDESHIQCPDDILSVNFSNSVIIVIGRDFISSSLITCLNLMDNKIENIAEGAFRKLSKLTHLYLSKNRISRSKELFNFGGHKTLKVLALNNAVRSTYPSIIPVIPGDYPNLEILSARKNGFADLTSSEKILYSELSTHSSSSSILKSPFPKLKILDLSGNSMSGTNFANLLPESLMHLHLEDNKLNSLQLLKNGNLTILTLDNNSLQYIRKYSNNPKSWGLQLSGLKNLSHLSISRNRINTVESIAFQDTIKLTHLNLSANEINNLYPETFAKLQLLKTLDLSRNKIQKVPEISNEINITALYLNCNQIKKISGHAFARTPELKELSLNGNQIDEVDINGFSSLFYLEKLDLSSNKLSSLPKGWTGAFRSLKYLDLSNNQLTSLESLSLTSMLPLVEVYLTMNPLKYLDARSTDSLPQNATVNLVNELYKNVAC